MATQNSTPNTAELKKSVNQFQDWLELYFVKKVPALPAAAKEFIVKYGPYLIILGLLLAIPAIMLALGVTHSLSIYGVSYSAFNLSSIFILVTFVLEAAALPGLFARKLSGWNLLFYSELVTALGQLVTLNIGSIIGMLIGLVIGLYFLFQIKSYYK